MADKTDKMNLNNYDNSNAGGIVPADQGWEPLTWTPTVRDLTDEQTAAALRDGYTSSGIGEDGTAAPKPKRKTPKRHDETGQFVGDEATYDDNDEANED